MIHVIAIITAKPGKRDEVLKNFKDNIPAVHAEKGCIEYGATVDIDGGPFAKFWPRHVRRRREVGIHGRPQGTRRVGAHEGLRGQEQGLARQSRRPRPAKRLISVTEADVAAYERDGVVCLRGAFDAVWVGILCEAVERALLKPGPNATNFAEGSTAGKFFGDMFMWQRDNDFRLAALTSPAGEIAAALMRSEHADFFYDQLFVKEPGIASHALAPGPALLARHRPADHLRLDRARRHRPQQRRRRIRGRRAILASARLRRSSRAAN